MLALAAVADGIDDGAGGSMEKNKSQDLLNKLRLILATARPESSDWDGSDSVQTLGDNQHIAARFAGVAANSTTAPASRRPGEACIHHASKLTGKKKINGYT